MTVPLQPRKASRRPSTRKTKRRSVGSDLPPPPELDRAVDEVAEAKAQSRAWAEKCDATQIELEACTKAAAQLQTALQEEKAARLDAEAALIAFRSEVAGITKLSSSVKKAAHVLRQTCIMMNVVIGKSQGNAPPSAHGQDLLADSLEIKANLGMQMEAWAIAQAAAGAREKEYRKELAAAAEAASKGTADAERMEFILRERCERADVQRRRSEEQSMARSAEHAVQLQAADRRLTATQAELQAAQEEVQRLKEALAAQEKRLQQQVEKAAHAKRHAVLLRWQSENRALRAALAARAADAASLRRRLSEAAAAAARGGAAARAAGERDAALRGLARVKRLQAEVKTLKVPDNTAAEHQLGAAEVSALLASNPAFQRAYRAVKADPEEVAKLIASFKSLKADEESRDAMTELVGERDALTRQVLALQGQTAALRKELQTAQAAIRAPILLPNRPESAPPTHPHTDDTNFNLPGQTQLRQPRRGHTGLKAYLSDYKPAVLRARPGSARARAPETPHCAPAARQKRPLTAGAVRSS
ncbi:hypothetical protein JKP88DRAFT_241967 [Tribonema minus]|uniref:Uncharacterized protein n=1 Tax=Tribonema minus TaxID=303371 RepID=A0A836CAI1_9STRA|nr:hypothetical protein JKP88DRAFT_241967 [Tribonema minus]